MLQRVKLTNFQRHRNLEVEFGPGLTALRGANEAGKSTLLRGVCYALFGASALAGTLEETVTWGEDVKTLKVELELLIDGALYKVKRSKGGAEVHHPGGTVTGQKEITAFLCKHLRIDAAAATRLVLSNQNEIRGALEAGAKATTDMIERLAEFSQIDELITLMESKLTLGNSASVEAAISAAQAQLDAARVKAVPPELTPLQEAASRATHELTAAEARHKEVSDLVTDLRIKRSEQKSRAQLRQSLGSQMENAQQRAEKDRKSIATLEAVQPPTEFEARVARLNERIANEARLGQLQAVLKEAESFMKSYWSGATWDDTPESLADEIGATQARISDLSLNIERARGEIRLQEQKLTHGTCTFCGKDFSGVPEVAERNAQVSARIAELKAQVEGRSQALANERETLVVLQKIATAAGPALSLLRQHPTLLGRADNELPTKLAWIGPDVSGTLDLSGLRSELSQLQILQRAYEAAQARLPGLRQNVVDAVAEAESIAAKIAALPADDPNLLRDLDAATTEYGRLDAHLLVLKGNARSAHDAVRDAERAYKRALEEVATHEATIEQRKGDLKTLQFNNALMKRVKAARPLIVDKIWGLVLGAVSTYFSEMRGTQSAVTKTSDGFKVDGHPVETLSGSTLDILGLAIRVALVRTFLPTAPFLVLDEPAAACDEARTGNMLGFLVGCGFGQILLVTHEDVSESVANNVIQIGGSV